MRCNCDCIATCDCEKEIDFTDIQKEVVDAQCLLAIFGLDAIAINTSMFF